MRGDAYALALAIYPLSAGAEERIYDAVEACGFGSDEKKADLYSQLAERLGESTPFERAVNIIECAMLETELNIG